MKWAAREIARTLYLGAFNSKHLVMVPNCYYPGSECDFLVVRADLRMMDVEIKISRADLKADAAKDKWFDMADTWPHGTERPKAPRTHPKRIWKHYYAVPQDIWREDLVEFIQPTSGIILIRDSRTKPFSSIRRQAKPNKDCDRISLSDLAQLARITTDRMWAAFDEIDSHRRDLESKRVSETVSGE